jgi:NADH-quinone oxidoreductase subunit D
VGIAAHEIGFDTLFMHVWRDRETVMNILEFVSGNRVNYAMNTIGGVRRDISTEMVSKIKDGLNFLEKRIKYYIKTVSKEPTILKRTVDVGVLKPRDAVELCAVGPTLRASGIKNDVRRDDPYAAYDEVPFNVITNDGCDVFARILVRCEEMLESIDMIYYALDHMPTGMTRVRVPMTVPTGEVVSRVEAPRGELIHYAKSNGTNKPERYKVRSPTLANLPALCKMLLGQHIADIPIVLAGIDPCFACMDRIALVDIKTGKRKILNFEALRRHTQEWYKTC